MAQAYTPRVISTIASKPTACGATVSGMGANWDPTRATRPGPANANVTLAQARRCEPITKRVSSNRGGGYPSSAERFAAIGGHRDPLRTDSATRRNDLANLLGTRELWLCWRLSAPS